MKKKHNLTFYYRFCRYIYTYICDRINIIEFEFSSNFVRMNGINTLVLSLILLNSIQRKKRNTFTRLGNICSRSSWKLCRSDLPCARECARECQVDPYSASLSPMARQFQDDRLEKKIILELSRDPIPLLPEKSHLKLATPYNFIPQIHCTFPRDVKTSFMLFKNGIFV